MWLKSVQIRNFRCFKNFSIAFDRQLTVIVARNGMGKTAVLEAISCLLGRVIGAFGAKGAPGLLDTDYHQEWELSPEGGIVKKPSESLVSVSGLLDVAGYSHWNRYPMVIPWSIEKVRSGIELNESVDRLSNRPRFRYNRDEIKDFVRSFGQSETPSCDTLYPLLIMYGTERVIPRMAIAPGHDYGHEYNRLDAYKVALQGQINYKKLVSWLLFVENRDNAEAVRRQDLRYQSIERQTTELAISRVLPGFCNLRAKTNKTRLEIDYRKNGVFQRFIVDRQLSDGYKIVLTLVLDLVSRILMLNGGVSNVTPESLLATKGIVLIDEVDLHLHPAWQVHIIQDLCTCFPNIQFIVTTHSPHIIQGVKAKQIVPLVERNGNVVVLETENTEYAYQGWTINEVLSDVMGVESLNSKVYCDAVRAFDDAVDSENQGAANEAFEQLSRLLHRDNPLIEYARIQKTGIDNG